MISRLFTALAAAGVMIPATVTAQQHHNKEHNMKNIVQVATEAGQFKTLVAAVKAAGLAETLQGDGPFTVFAPTDAAFEKLPPGTLEALLKDKEKLAAILTYHVVPAKVLAADVIKAKGAKPTTVNGQALDIELRGSDVFVDGARVVMTDIMASNGVIHVIDAVVLPGVTVGSGR